MGRRKDIVHFFVQWHFFVQCPHLYVLLAGAASPIRLHTDTDVPALLDELAENLPRMHASARTNIVLMLLLSVWRSRGRMVFDIEFVSTPRILAMVVEHLQLWVVRAPSRVDSRALFNWCTRVS